MRRRRSWPDDSDEQPISPIKFLIALALVTLFG